MGTQEVHGLIHSAMTAPQLSFSFRSAPQPEEGSLRLVGGMSPYEGRVEVFYNSLWGTVCDDMWDVIDAAVVCKQLSYGPAQEAPPAAFFGPGSGIIHLDNVDCQGTERRLIDCVRAATHNCNHGEDAGVKCASQTGKWKFLSPPPPPHYRKHIDLF